MESGNVLLVAVIAYQIGMLDLRPARPRVRHAQAHRHRRHAGDQLAILATLALCAQRAGVAAGRAAIIVMGFSSVPPAPW